MHIKYKARRSNGEIYQAEGDFTDRFVLYQELHKAGDTIFEVSEHSAKPLISKDKLMELLMRIGLHDQIIFLRNLGSMIKAGLSVTRALSVLERQTKNPRLRLVVESLQDEVTKGKSLSTGLTAFPDIFSPLVVSMVKVAEESGNLADSLQTLALQMDKVYLLKKKVRGAMMYPGIIMAAMVCIGVLMLIYVVPSLTTTFTELKVELPASTSFLIGLSAFVTENLLLAIVILVIFIVFMFAISRTSWGKRYLDWLWLHMPLLGTLAKQTNVARIARTLSTLLSAGVPVVQALSITADVTQNFFYRDTLIKAGDSIQKGVTISSVFGRYPKLYPPFVTEMTSVGEEAGNLTAMLLEIAVFYESEVEQKTKDMSTIIEPFLMIVIGVAVGFFALSMLSPMYSLVDAI
jgi:type IV pilus assembly protein PilC